MESPNNVEIDINTSEPAEEDGAHLLSSSEGVDTASLSDSEPSTFRLRASSRALDELALDLEVDPSKGLSSDSVEHRLQEHGHNELTSEDEESMLSKFLGQFKDPLILLLLGSGAVSVLMGHTDDAVSIGVAISIVVTVAFVQEYRSEKTLEALKELVPPRCHCLRDGEVQDIYARDLVPGDVIVISVGDRIPADARLIEAAELEVDESNLTGETHPVAKHTLPIVDAHKHPVAERKNIVYMGTLVRSGRGRAVVYGTGSRTEFGLVFDTMHRVEERKTPLQANMDTLGKHLSVFSIGIISVIVLIGVIQGKGLLSMIQIGVSLAVAAIPEGLPICVTVTLAFGVMKMAKRHAVVKKLPAVEALGCINVVCVDKTGTVTTNQMEVTEVFVPFQAKYAQVNNIGQRKTTSEDVYADKKTPHVTIDQQGVTESSHPHVYHCLLTGALCNNASIVNGEVLGQATEGAVLLCAHKSGITADHLTGFQRVDEIPFSSEKKWMAVCCDKDGVRTWYAKGMTEAILARCDLLEDNTGQLRTLTADDKRRITDESLRMATRGLRVLSLAFGDEIEGGMAFSGLVGLADPPRPEVAKSVQELAACNVKTVMLTGDSKETALAIAGKVGIIDESQWSEAEDLAVSGTQLETMGMEELEKRILNTHVFYRTRPRDKLKIVRAFQEAGLQVAMTGDGVNDAPSLKAADIGIAMGTSGTDVSKEASDMILLDDNFATIVCAMEEGKSIYHNLKHFLRFQLSTSISALSLIAFSTLFNLPSPLNAMQILWINIIMDGPPAQSLGVEPVDHDVMKEGPRAKDTNIITRVMLRRVLTSACFIVCGTLFVFYKELADDGTVSSRDRTMSFTTFVMFDMFNALSCRSSDKSVFSIGLLSNTFFAFAVGASILGQLLVIYFPPLQSVFHTEALSLGDLAYICTIASSVLVCDEVRKWWRSGGRHRAALQAVAAKGFTKRRRSADAKKHEKA